MHKVIDWLTNLVIPKNAVPNCGMWVVTHFFNSEMHLLFAMIGKHRLEQEIGSIVLENLQNYGIQETVSW
jgi:hypothetical protein